MNIKTQVKAGGFWETMDKVRMGVSVGLREGFKKALGKGKKKVAPPPPETEE